MRLRGMPFLLFLWATLLLASSCTSQPQHASTQEGFTVHIPQRGYMRSKTTIEVEAPPDTECELIFISPSGEDSQQAGLGATTADENGRCTWNFVIEEAERKYDARLLIYVDGVSETHFMEIRKAY